MPAIDHLRTIVSDAFCDVPPPEEGETFTAYDPDCDDFLDVYERSGSTWATLLRYLESGDEVAAWRIGAAFHFLTPTALHYFTPMYLLFSLDSKSGDLPSTLTFLLGPMSHELNPMRRFEYLSNIWGLYSERQRFAVGATILLLNAEGHELPFDARWTELVFTGRVKREWLGLLPVTGD